MKKKLRILILLAAAGGGVYYWQTGRLRANNQTHIAVSGNLELTLVDLSFKSAGRMTELLAREGSTVKKGDVIARLDPVQLEQQTLRDRAAISTAQSNYEQLQTAIAYQHATIEGDVAARQAELNQVQARLDDLLAGSRPQEIRQAEAALADARAQLNWAELDLKRAQTLYKNEDIAKSQFDQAQTKFNSVAALLEQAEQRLALVKEGPRKQEIAAARAGSAGGGRREARRSQPDRTATQGAGTRSAAS